MKKHILISLLLIVCTMFSKAQQAPPDWLWLQGSGGSGYQYGGGVGTDDSGNIYIGGRFGSTITFGTQMETASSSLSHLFGKFNPSGTCVWLSQEPGGGFDYPRGFCVDKANPNNEYQDGNENSGDGMFVDKVNNDGQVQWEATVGTSSYEGYGGSPNGDGIAADVAGNVYATGETGDGSWTMGDSTLTCGTSGVNWPQPQEAFLTKLDNSGHFLWSVGVRGIDAANEGYDVGRAVILDKTAQYVYVAGGYQDTTVFHSKYSTGDITLVGPGGGASNLYLAKYDTAGNLLSVATAGNAGLPWINGFNSGVGASYGLGIDSCDNVYVVGNFSGTVTFGPFALTAQGSNDCFVATCNSLGQWQWVDDFGGTGASTGGGNIALDKNNDIYVDGAFKGTTNFGNGVSLTSVNGSPQDLFIAKLANSNGAVQWAQTSTGTGNNGAGGITVDTNKFVVVDGTFYGSFGLPGTQTITATGGESNIFLAKLDTVPTLYIVPVIDSSYCPGSTDTIYYSIRGTFNSGNVFTAQLSDSTGSFVNDTNIGSTTSSTGGYIVVTIPANTPPGNNYLIRVISSNPATSSYVNGCGAYYQSNVYINNFFVSIGSGKLNISLSPVNPNLCNGGSITLTASGGNSYSWSSGSTSDTTTVSPTVTTTYTLMVSNGGCSKDTSIVVTVNHASPLTINAQSPSVCNGEKDLLTVPISGSDYNWSPSVSLNTTTGDSVIANPSAAVTYTVSGTDSLGCAVSGSVTIGIVPPPAFYINPRSSNVCSGSPTVLTVDTTGNNYTWTPSIGLNTTIGDTTIILNPTSTLTYTVTGTDSLGCTVSATDTISVIPAPNKPTITIHWDTLISSATSDNQWNYEGKPINGAVNPTYVVTGSTAGYSVTVTNEANGCTTTSDTTTTTGINQLSGITDQLLIYPNPFNNNIFIKVNSSASNVNEWSLKLTDVLGRTVYTNSSLNYNNELDLSSLPSGFYFITVTNKTSRAVFPVVKQN